MVSRVTHVTSRDNPLLARLRKLARRPSEYRNQGEVLLEGEHLCDAWQRAAGGLPAIALIAESAWTGGRVPAAVHAAPSVVVVADALWAAIGSLESPASMACLVALPPSPPLGPGEPTVILDRLQDPGNVGSVLRSAAAFGYVQVIALRGTALLWSPKVLRAAMGAHFGLRLVEGVDEDALRALAVPLLATSSHAGASLDEADLPWPCAWVFGNEGEGVGVSLQSQCAMQVRIRQPGGEESLNVAAAAAICLHESRRRIGRD